MTRSTTPQNSRPWRARAATPTFIPWPRCPARDRGRVAGVRLRAAGRLAAGRFAGGRRVVVTVATKVTGAPLQSAAIPFWLQWTSVSEVHCSEFGVLDLDDDRHDHRPPPGPLVHELAQGGAGPALEGLEVSRALLLLGALDAGDDGRPGLPEQVLGLGGEHPAPRDDLGVDQHLARLGVDGDDNDDDAFLGKHAAVAQATPAY